ncbi:putative PHD type zinc finger protein with BAH domain-containing protein [Cladophialophora chaetospira]|uniref:PHD type zinc finger protein with BAH domain-containing protein n=1 Tax=Cladophialophora chaetospira TaxID=386627 RepID=A0AA38X8T9_9EURO|nr:putative PHD type zinc finger protein with BAH domain-containing protein [Cladophialophora chaetospira]
MSTGDTSVANEALDTRPPPDASSKAGSASGKGSRSVSPRPQNTTAPPSEANLQSQPMTATGSSSSLHPPLENGDNAASGYGTRSRNRTGGARPNYAEDKEVDLEIEALSKPSRTNKRSSGAANELQPASAGFASVNGGPASDKGTEVVPATASAPPPAPAPSKKRKHPGSNHTVATTSTSTSTSRAKSTVSLPFKGYVETNMMSFTRGGYKLNAKKQLVADDGTAIQANDHVYLICEPPGEPYYLARIMEFLHAKNDPEGPVDAIRVNWYYRPKDIARRVQDTRVVFASMHSDTCPLTSLRGKCNIRHLAEISNMDDYRGQPDSFWFNQLYDRYMHRYYEVIPTNRVVNVPHHVKTVLDSRWKFVLMEVGRGRELTSESKKCVKCEQFASNHDSVDCAVCKRTYHMQCVRPPLLKKPARGFAWACAACSRAQELRLDSRSTPLDSEVGDDDPMDEDEDEHRVKDTRDSSAVPEPHPEPTKEQIAQANLWQWRYLGIHSRVEDALDYDDRIYPRASSRLGPRHQANVNIWHGRPVELVKPAEIKKKYKNAHHIKGAKGSKDTGTDTDRDQKHKRPKWVIDEPVGYVARGQDEPIENKGKKEYTAQLTFKMPDPVELSERGEADSERPEDSNRLVDDYMARVKPIAARYNLLDSSVDFLTKAVEKLQEHNYDVENAIKAMAELTPRGDLKQPELTREEIKRFEEGVAKYGSELHAVARHVGNIKESRIVRFYYMWKKTDRGRQIWGTYEGRRSKKDIKRADKDGNVTKLLDDVADDHDDSAFDDEKAVQKKRGFLCKFCGTLHSRQWRRAPATAPGTLAPKDASSKISKDKSGWCTLALCGRCAYLWRKYAIQYEDIEEISKKIAASGSRAAKRKVDEELLRTILEAHQMSGDPLPPKAVDEVNKAGLDVPQNIIQPEEPPKKKGKTDKDTGQAMPDVIPEKKKAPEKPQEPPPIEPDPPKVKIHPCAVCRVIDVQGQELLKCRDCRLHVHGSCYGVGQKTNTKPWFCDMCRNDHNLQVSTTYECVLCPIKHTAQELMEPLKASHKKKSDREREKERIEKEIIQEASRRWRMEQEAAGRPVNPREALKRTAWNNWIHITCALWTKEIKFGNSELLDDAEGVGFIPPERFEPICKICKVDGLPTVKCQQVACNNYFHVGCAHQADYIFGFDVQPVKGSRRDSVNIMKLDSESGHVSAAIWCPSHPSLNKVHNMLEMTEAGITALQLFARTYKQVDNSVTGTVRRAAQFTSNSASTAPAVQPPQRRASIANGRPNGAVTHAEQASSTSLRDSPAVQSPIEVEEGPSDSRTSEKLRNKSSTSQRKCCTCCVGVSPRWWPLTQEPPVSNGMHMEVHGAGRVETVMSNGIVKVEPADGSALATITDGKDRTMYQCHKCHVQKRTPPSSPSQVKPREKPIPTEQPPEPVSNQPPFPPPPHNVYTLGRPPMEGPPHPHAHLGGPPLPPYPPWSNGPQWPSPGVRANGRPSPPPGPGLYGPPLYRPPHPDYASPYGRAGHPVPYPPGPAHLPQHSPPPPGPYGHPPPPHHHGIPPTGPPLGVGRPPSPPRYGPDRPPIPSPHLGLGSSLLSRGYPEPPRQPSSGSPVNGYAAPRGYGQPPPPPPPMRQSPSTQSLAQIAQAATEQTGPAARPHSRQDSVEMTGTGTPRFGPRPVPESPQARPLTPSGSAANIDRRDERRDGLGASASPSVKNLLS